MMTPAARVGLYLGTHPDDANALGKGFKDGFVSTINPINWVKGLWSTIRHPIETGKNIVSSFKNSYYILENGSSQEQFELLGNFIGCEAGALLVGELSSSIGQYGKNKIINNKINKTIESPAIQASKWQGKGNYPGVDNWTNVKIKKGSYVWGGIPGQSEFYTTTADIMSVGNDATKIFQGLQVSKGKYPLYREYMACYKVPYDMDIAISQALANTYGPEGIFYGKGGFTQLFIPNFEDLQLVDVMKLTNR